MEDPAILVAVAVILVIALSLATIYVWSIAWVIRDSRVRGKAGLPLPLLLLFGPLTAVAWLAIRPRELLADKPPSDYQSAEDAFQAASELDALGSWDQAIALYQYGADRWPEHRSYAENSINRIRGKQR